MKENQPSRTAQLVAIRRAAHQLLDNPKVFDDPLALSIIGQERALALQNGQDQSEDPRLSLHLRAFYVARSRCAEDELVLAVGRGVRQYVILGAGLDTFAYRNPYPKGALRVFEVDHPATQAWKRARLEEAGISLPVDLTFAPVDFEAQGLADGLQDAGYDPSQSAFFSWLGVTMYLTTEGVMKTLRFIASAPIGSGVVFDYTIRPSLLTPDQRLIFDTLYQRVDWVREPWQMFFDPAELKKDVQAMGFGHVEDIGPAEINARYFKERTDGLRVGSLAHIMHARV
ncbi:MAG TPA: class I SAM-dependent methyltransferase [Blastocatellia bacterium]|jgi:methyltransferase (TIGR00027 family)|nr:class I SAM-dependent methyltransferase [Blastocatellia bacterium]